SKESAFVIRVGQTRGAPQRHEGAQRRGGSGQSERSTPNFLRPTSTERGSQLMQYSCWCPKVIAAIGRLPETLADRCIMITMQRKSGKDRCERLQNLDAAELRQRCARFV